VMLVKVEKAENRFTIKSSRSKNGYLLALYIVVTASFFFIVMFHERGYQDAWILDGILLPTMIFVFVSIVVETFVSGNSLTAIVASTSMAVLCVIPGLKYQLFLGCYDSVIHFGTVERLISLGRIPQTGYYASYYSDVPGMHLFISSLSIVSGISVNELFRFVLPATYFIIPLIIYFITKGVLDKTVQRHIIIASSFPIVIGYIIVGTTFALIIYVLFVAVFLRRAFTSENKAEYSVLLLILAFTLIISHGVTSLFLLFLLVGMLLALKFAKFMKKKFPSRSLINGYTTASFFFMVLLMAWWTWRAQIYLVSLSGIIERIFFIGAAAGPVPARFFVIPLSAQLEVLTVLYLRDVIIGIVSLFGMLILIKQFRRRELNEKTKDFYLHLLLFLAIILAQPFLLFAIQYGGIEYDRFINYAIILSPLLAGIALWRLDEYSARAFKNAAIRGIVYASILFMLFSLCLIQTFRFQPMIPRANVLSKDLPEDEYIFDIRVVNTVYQREMIAHAERYSPTNARIASDLVTRFQIYGFTDPSFASNHIWYSPLENQNLTWDLFLLHMDERAGPFNEKAEYHTKERIDEFRETGNIIYDNGISFIISS
jgi:hypothetical protein